jgi:hypothetical protein
MTVEVTDIDSSWLTRSRFLAKLGSVVIAFFAAHWVGTTPAAAASPACCSGSPECDCCSGQSCCTSGGCSPRNSGCGAGYGWYCCKSGVCYQYFCRDWWEHGDEPCICAGLTSNPCVPC